MTVKRREQLKEVFVFDGYARIGFYKDGDWAEFQYETAQGLPVYINLREYENITEELADKLINEIEAKLSKIN